MYIPRFIILATCTVLSSEAYEGATCSIWLVFSRNYVQLSFWLYICQNELDSIKYKMYTLNKSVKLRWNIWIWLNWYLYIFLWLYLIRSHYISSYTITCPLTRTYTHKHTHTYTSLKVLLILWIVKINLANQQHSNYFYHNKKWIYIFSEDELYLEIYVVLRQV